MFEFIISPKDRPRKEAIRSVGDERIYTTTLRDRILALAEKSADKIRDRNIATSLKNVNKIKGKENPNYRVLREIESMFQNSALSMIIGRDRFFRNKAISDNDMELLGVGATQMFKKLGDDAFANREGQKIVRGINSVYQYVAEVYHEQAGSAEKFFVGTNDYVDAAHEIDLIVAKETSVDLVQVKTSKMEDQDIASIHESHREFLKTTHKDSLDYLHILIENYSKDIDSLLDEDPVAYEKLALHMNDIHHFLEWMKPLFDERSKFMIDNQFVEETKEVSEMESVDTAQMAFLFQKGDVLHNIFMIGEGDYSKIFQKITDHSDVLDKKERILLKNEGILSLLYHNEFLEKVSRMTLDNTEAQKFSQYVSFMRSLDSWSINFLETMDVEQMRKVQRSYYEIIKVDETLVINQADKVFSVVAHGGKKSRVQLI